MGRFRRFKRRLRGVPRGYKHKWWYNRGKWNETKIGPGKWRITWTAVKGRRGSRAKFHRNAPGIGTKIQWNIRAKQYAQKISPNKYVTRMVGTKTLARIKYKKFRRKY